METYKWLINETFTVLGWVSKIEQESHDVPLNLGVFFLFRLWPSASSPNLMMDHHFSPATCFIFPTRMGHLWPKKTHSELRLFPGEAFQTRIVPLGSSATCQKSKRRKIKPGSRLQRPWDFLGFPTFSNHQDAVFYGGLMAYENSWEEKTNHEQTNGDSHSQPQQGTTQFFPASLGWLLDYQRVEPPKTQEIDSKFEHFLGCFGRQLLDFPESRRSLGFQAAKCRGVRAGAGESNSGTGSTLVWLLLPFDLHAEQHLLPLRREVVTRCRNGPFFFFQVFWSYLFCPWCPGF